jgi:hypothetical protein
VEVEGRRFFGARETRMQLVIVDKRKEKLLMMVVVKAGNFSWGILSFMSIQKYLITFLISL